LQDNDETNADDKYRMNQAEAVLHLDFDVKTGPLNWKIVTRFDKEMQTDYLDDLEERMTATANAFGLQGNYSSQNDGGAAGAFANYEVQRSKDGGFMDQYDTVDDAMDFA